ncbi:MAG: peptide chain release factor 1 [Nitrosopumilales archaeon CG11_big_fil_rev_8_21_14_0_20_33_24]|nr:MAG: peptide chain release factor 1 [Nitrosopumilales archaeon CG11_big_fil_rev_8_21_14_0_20_33_24]PIY88145.1 MAG: peptide chain release factor 1 [Nitrosopumilales archaeon CG_4_10_14_0_8_um_filter_34_8]PJB99018.1 MAG: peptide chain release factor 1 [Nitrosopumilales archaeon CG_4_9_14_0_8_um_filter_34_10]
MEKINIEKVDSVKLYKIRKMLEELSQKSGRGTELISVYIPKGKQLHEIIGTLQQEQGTADNIKSDLTRSHVVDSLGKVIQRLKLLKKTPERGLVMFCGALPPEGGGPLGSEVVKVWEIDPPKDLKQYLYRCDDHFHVDILKDMLKDDNLIGFLAIDAKDAGWGLLHGDKIEVLSQTGSGVAGKHRQGGQSAKRFQKLREMELSYFYNRVAGTTREYFIDIYPVKGLIISGPGPTKEDFINGNYLEYRLQNMIINTIDAGYSGAEGIREAFAKSGELLSDFRMVEEKKLIEDLFREINSHSGLGVYGLQDVIELLKNNVVKILIITDDTNLNRVEGICRRCQHLQEVIVERRDVIPKKTEYASKPCPGCNAMEVEPNEQDIVDYLELLAAKTGSRLEVVSGSAEHGTMLSSLGKVGAILRYNPGHTKEAKT